MKNLTPFAGVMPIFKAGSVSIIGTLTYLINRDAGKSRSDALLEALKSFARAIQRWAIQAIQR